MATTGPKHYRVRFIGHDGVTYHTYALGKTARAAAKWTAENPPRPGVREVIEVTEVPSPRPPTKASVARARAAEARRRAAARAQRQAEAAARKPSEEKLSAEEEFERRFGLDRDRSVARADRDRSVARADRDPVLSKRRAAHATTAARRKRRQTERRRQTKRRLAALSFDQLVLLLERRLPALSFDQLVLLLDGLGQRSDSVSERLRRRVKTEIQRRFSLVGFDAKAAERRR